MRGDVGKYRLEIIVALLAVVGVVFIVVGGSLQNTVLNQARDLVSGGTNAVQTVGERINQFLATRSVFDLIGIALVIGAVGFLIWRVRYWVIHSSRWVAKTCPACGNELTRVPRRLLDRGVSLILPVHRYACNRPTCGWQGLRISRGKRRKDGASNRTSR